MSLSSGWVISLALLQILSIPGGTQDSTGPPDGLLFSALAREGHAAFEI